MDAIAFADVSAITETAAGQFAAEVNGEYTIGGKPNGGYLLSLLARAGVAVVTQDHVIAASTHYLHSPDPGPVHLDAEVLRAGRSASQVRVRMSQDGVACVETLMTVGHLGDTEPDWTAGVPHAPTAAWADCVKLPARAPSGLRVSIMDQVDIRLDPDCLGFASGHPSGRGELRGWLTLPHGEAFTPNSLLFAVDAFPPGTFEIEMTGWVPTLELTVYVRARPAPGPVRVLQRAQLIQDQRVDEVCYVWDSTGRLVAHGTQLAGIRLGTPRA